MAEYFLGEGEKYCGGLLEYINLSGNDFHRYRDCYIEKDEDTYKLVVNTREELIL